MKSFSLTIQENEKESCVTIENNGLSIIRVVIGIAAAVFKLKNSHAMTDENIRLLLKLLLDITTGESKFPIKEDRTLN